ncbi:hypothetical protein BC827DRAFT_1379522 [Russula dissimulans]|nr:hypothetical protein BC827DRAFT_1379522 [Russula dissimulans]
MSVDTNFNAPDAIQTWPKGEPHSSLVDNSSSADEAGLRSFQFTFPGSEFDFAVTLPAYPDGDGDPSYWHGEESLYHSPDSSNPSSCNSTLPSGVASLSQNLRCDNQRNTLLANGGDVSTDCDEASCSAMERGDESTTTGPNIYLSLENANLSMPLMAELEEGSTIFQRKPAGWTYRRVLEVVAIPPPGPPNPHLWTHRVTQLAAELGMPPESTGRDIVLFVMHIATVKGELDKVAPLIKAFSAAAIALEGRVVGLNKLLPVVLALYPGVMPLPTTAQKRPHDEISSESESAPRSEVQSSLSPHGSEEVDEYDDDDDDDEPALQHSRFMEEDLYCRVGNCLWAFKDPRICVKHRLRHFPGRWVCPGPCRGESANGGRFARNETLKRHLLYPKNDACRKATLRVLDLGTTPTSGTAWLAPLRDGPERPWESPDFRLTDLNTVKEEKMKVCGSKYGALPTEHIDRRRRYK